MLISYDNHTPDPKGKNQKSRNQQRDGDAPDAPDASHHVSFDADSYTFIMPGNKSAPSIGVVALESAQLIGP